MTKTESLRDSISTISGNYVGTGTFGDARHKRASAKPVTLFVDAFVTVRLYAMSGLSSGPIPAFPASVDHSAELN